MMLIFYISSMPGSKIPDISIPNVDKIAHAAEYLILGFLLIRALSNSFQNSNLAKMIFSAIIVASLFAIFDEWHQRFIPGRMCDFFDFAADFIGANIGVLLYRMKG